MLSLDHGEVVVVERRIGVDATVARSLAELTAACYFDTETTGLSTSAGTLLFLAGAARVDGTGVRVTQYVLPDQPDEPALLALVAAELERADRVVTYNGRAFDLPLLAARLTLHGMRRAGEGLPRRHDDLLHPARRLWRRTLGGARLAQIEAGVLGVRRGADCPSAEIPARYLAYLRGAAPELLVEVLEHNAHDVVSLALLEARLAALSGGAWRTASDVDPRGMALELLRLGRTTDAVELLQLALEDVADDGDAVPLRRLASRLLVAAGETARAEAVWRTGTRRAAVSAALAWLEIARIRERYREDVGAALEATHAASRVLDLALALGRGGGIAEIGRARLAVDARRRRLTRRVAAANRARTSRHRAAGGSVSLVAAAS